MPHFLAPLMDKDFVQAVVLSSTVLSIVAAGLGLAIKGWLAREFVTKAEIVGLARRQNDDHAALAALTEAQHRNAADTAMLQREQAQQWQRVTERVIVPLDKIAARMENLALASERHATILEGLMNK